MSVEIFEEERRGVVVVPDDQISLAIGKGWRNVKLASKLTRYYLDVKSVSEMQAEGFEIDTGEEPQTVEAAEDAPPDTGEEQEQAAAVDTEESAEAEAEEFEGRSPDLEDEDAEETAMETASAEHDAANSEKE